MKKLLDQKQYITNLLKQTSDYNLIGWNYSLTLSITGFILFVLTVNPIVKILSFISICLGFILNGSTNANWYSLFVTKEKNRVKFIKKLDGRDWNYLLLDNKARFLKYKISSLILHLVLLMLPIIYINFILKLDFIYLIALNSITLICYYIFTLWLTFIDFIFINKKISNYKQLIIENNKFIKQYKLLNLIYIDVLFIKNWLTILVLSIVTASLAYIIVSPNVALIGFIISFIMFSYKTLAIKSGLIAKIYMDQIINDRK